MSVAAAQWDAARSLRLASRLRAVEPRPEAMGMVREGILHRARSEEHTSELQSQR